MNERANFPNLESQLQEATQNSAAAREAFNTAKTSRARREADEQLQFWSSKAAYLQAIG